MLLPGGYVGLNPSGLAAHRKEASPMRQDRTEALPGNHITLALYRIMAS